MGETSGILEQIGHAILNGVVLALTLFALLMLAGTIFEKRKRHRVEEARRITDQLLAKGQHDPARVEALIVVLRRQDPLSQEDQQRITALQKMLGA
ncbi:MAG: hypothetical protein ACE5HK_04000 [Candidatus Methylomirabilales bacterium]